MSTYLDRPRGPLFPGKKKWHPDFYPQEETVAIWLDAHSPRRTAVGTLVGFPALLLLWVPPTLFPDGGRWVVYSVLLIGLAGLVVVLWVNIKTARIRWRADKMIVAEWEAWRNDPNRKPCPRPSVSGEMYTPPTRWTGRVNE